MMKRFRTLLIFLPVIAALGGCAGPTPAARQALQQVRDDYAAGDYGGVIRAVATSDELARAPDALRVEALKLQSFSYCASRYTRLCEDGFVRILRIDPDFRLAPNEAGHPMWGPAFERAQTMARAS
ncbi:TssQ family T6SS-associated lipoprotein [Bordetella genomosp. 9]|uniref:Lipoprotein n=1 Tax=Bordetella genomosp. 9 TaxID=1416803 RepID=A0A1W6Z400_9BORD|nr:TssQ family T6SS-associated lipoprotein [Bordetella genomosp. 9]ARP87829.1 hypothetical protein CAL13_17625 [Bordetella genomosp. 9]ARP91788.1 hypothetical protein CAL14_17080 [Bordetella genomosp. 9]